MTELREEVREAGRKYVGFPVFEVALALVDDSRLVTLVSKYEAEVGHDGAVALTATYLWAEQEAAHGER